MKLLFRNGISNGNEAYFSPYWLKGSLQGETYTITAYAVSYEDEDRDGNSDSDTRSYKLTVWKPTVERIDNDHTDILGYVVITKLYYDPSRPGYAVCDGYIYLYNRSDDETYNIIDWGGRLECFSPHEVLAPDKKKHVSGGTLGPGEIFYESIALDMNLGARNAVVGREYTMQTDYWINISGGGVNQVDGAAPRETYKFTHDPE